MNKYQICNRCIMDNVSDKTISFDENGFCNYCTAALVEKEQIYFPNEIGEIKLEKLIMQLKEEGKNKKYDCIMGISGGLDSAYLAYLGAVKWGLRILAVHIDDGFDAKLATENIQKLVNKTGIELITIYPDQEQFNALTRAFFLAEVPNAAIPQDNILFSTLYHFAKKHKIYNFLSGGNFALESILQQDNTYGVFDKVHIKAINKIFGTTRLNKLKIYSQEKLYLDRKLFNMKTWRPLNYINYDKKNAIIELRDFCDFNYYKSKHLENDLTKIIQLIWFKEKFKVDKRTSHLSSLVVSGQMTREEALSEYAKPLYDKDQMEHDIENVLHKLNMNIEVFADLLKQPPKRHEDYPTSNGMFFNVLKRVKRWLGK